MGSQHSACHKGLGLLPGGGDKTLKNRDFLPRRQLSGAGITSINICRVSNRQYRPPREYFKLVTIKLDFFFLSPPKLAS